MADQHEKRFLPFTFPQDILSQIALLLKFIETAADRFYAVLAPARWHWNFLREIFFSLNSKKNFQNDHIFLINLKHT